MNKVSFFLVPSFSSSKWLNDKMMRITKRFLATLNMSGYPVHEIADYHDLNKYLEIYDYLIVVTAGNIIIERDHLWKKIHEIGENVGLMGNLLQHGDETPWMHEQFFIINTQAFTKLDFSTGETESWEILRSTEDMHDGHAPLYFSLGENKITRQDAFGTKLIEHCLLNGYSTSNWDMDWRYPPHLNEYILDVRLPSRGFCYPTRATKEFEYALKNITMVPGLDEAQSVLMDALIKAKQMNLINVWHYEQAILDESVDTVIVPATGFLAETFALIGNAKKIVFYDKNKNNIHFKRTLYEEWDGIDYDAFAKEYADVNNLSTEPVFEIDAVRAKQLSTVITERVFTDWEDWKNSKEFLFLDCDVITETDVLLKQAHGRTVLQTSTIFSVYPWTEIFYESDVIEQAEEKIKESTVIWIQT